MNENLDQINICVVVVKDYPPGVVKPFLQYENKTRNGLKFLSNFLIFVTSSIVICNVTYIDLFAFFGI